MAMRAKTEHMETQTDLNLLPYVDVNIKEILENAPDKIKRHKRKDGENL